MPIHFQKYQELTISNDFMFAKVMRNRKLCKKLLEVILGIKIEKIEYQEEQKTIDVTAAARSVRLDIYVKDNCNTVYNIEIQTTNPKNLPKRSRYYQSMIDLDLIEKGEDYSLLNKSYVIFICTEDVFGHGRHMYTFENRCLEDFDISLNDGTKKIFLNPIADMSSIEEDLRNFLQYLKNGKISDDFTRELDQEMVMAKSNKAWEVEFMTLNLLLNEKLKEGLEEGRAEGRLSILYDLVNDNVISMAEAACRANMTEEDFLKKLEKEK